MDALCNAGTPQRPVVLAIGGPTATGKTALAVALAKAFDGEVISADSMQIYRGLDIGTAKATVAERQGVPHHLIDSLEPEQPYSVADFCRDAKGLITEITARGHLPIVAGGTGLYITSLLNGVRFAPQKTDPALRAELERRAAAGEGAQLYAELCERDAQYAKTVHPNNLPRILRALELAMGTGLTMSEQRARSLPAEKPYRALCFCLENKDRALLYARMNARVDKMVQDGVLDEAAYVYAHRAALRTAAQAIGYKEFFPYLEGRATLEECTAALKQATRNYAKRQLTWFRHQTDAVWLEAAQPDTAAHATALAADFLNR